MKSENNKAISKSSMETAGKETPKCAHCGGYKIETYSGEKIEPYSGIKKKVAQAKFCSECFQYCSQCDGIGFVIKREAMGRDFAYSCSCRDIKKRVALFNKADIPGRFHDAAFDNFVCDSPSSKEALNTARFSLKNYMQGNKKGLLFMGGVGVGKSRLVSSMLREYILRYGISGLFQEFSHLLSEIKRGYDLGLPESVVLSKVSDIEVLVIDELGKGRKTDWEIAILDSIVSNRYNMDKVTICTTNYTDNRNTTYGDFSRLKNGKEKDEENKKKEILVERVHSRIYSRLKEMCDFQEIKGVDRRSVSDRAVSSKDKALKSG